MHDNRRTALVVGATGVQGSATARELVASGWRVRGLTRDPRSRRARGLAARGVELVRGDLDDRTSLEAAVAGAEAVHLVTAMDPRTYDEQREIAQATRLAEVVAAAGDCHLVFSSVAGAKDGIGVGHVDAKGVIEDRIHDLGVPATVLRPTIFMDNLVRRQVAPVYWRLAPSIIGWERPLPWIAAGDIGRIAAAIFDDPEPWRGRTLELTADRASLGRALELYRSVRGRRPFRAPINAGLFERLVGPELVVMWRWQASADLDRYGSSDVGALAELVDLQTWFHQQVRDPVGSSR